MRKDLGFDADADFVADFNRSRDIDMGIEPEMQKIARYQNGLGISATSPADPGTAPDEGLPADFDTTTFYDRALADDRAGADRSFIDLDSRAWVDASRRMNKETIA